MNRFSKTGFTAREQDAIESSIRRINNILQKRITKQDDPEALNNLRFAIESLELAMLLSNRWVIDQ